MQTALSIRILLVFTALSVSGGIGERSPASELKEPDFKEPDFKEPDFERHIAPLLGKLGCNAGSCHGAFQGKAGFRLSLFGHDADADFFAIARDSLGRRVSILKPEKSLLLLKATGTIKHGGGKRLAPDSWEYRSLHRWIAQGCIHHPGTGAVNTMQIVPSEHAFQRPGETISMRVLAQYADGTQADVTSFSEFRMKDEFIAQVSGQGEVCGLKGGDTPLIASYRGHLATANVLVPLPLTILNGSSVPQLSADARILEHNFVDKEVFLKLRRLNIVPSDLASDAEFLRRITIDTIGSLPTSEQVRAFLADPCPDKRERKIDELLVSPWHAALWATKFCDITACNIDTMDGLPELRSKRAQMWHDWFRHRLAENRPYREIVEGVLTATSREGLEIDDWIAQEIAIDAAAREGFHTDPYVGRRTHDLFWRRFSGNEFFPLEQMAELTATAFLGVRIDCAQCHKHPFDRWTQNDYRAFANAFGQVRFGSPPDLTEKAADLLTRRRESTAPVGPPIPRLREVYLDHHDPRVLGERTLYGALKPKALGGPTLDETLDPRRSLFRWLVQSDNPYFARSFVNRVWAHYLGVGLVEPVDDFSVANPPSNPRLLAALAQDFVAHDYDIRRLERLILMSRTYQLSSLPNGTNAGDRSNYSRALPRPMMAEVVVDVLNAALGSDDDFGPDVQPESRAIDIASNRVSSPHLARVFRVFGRPQRTSTCDCERPNGPTIPQTLYLMSDPVVLQKIAKGRLPGLLAKGSSDAELTDELFLATLSRFPTVDEKQNVLSHADATKDRGGAFVDLLWALINTREFILNQ